MSTDPDHFIFKISCPATSGIVAAVTSFLADNRCYISELAQFDDEETSQFFMRAVFRFNSGVKGDIDALRLDFNEVATALNMDWQLHSVANPMRVLIIDRKSVV